MLLSALVSVIQLHGDWTNEKLIANKRPNKIKKNFECAESARNVSRMLDFILFVSQWRANDEKEKRNQPTENKSPDSKFNSEYGVRGEAECVLRAGAQTAKATGASHFRFSFAKQ